jgi:hypothetical protein
MMLSSVPIASLAGLASSTALSGENGRMSVAVSRSNYIYAHFEHVLGIPAPEGSTGLSVNAARTLDLLIDRQQTRLQETRGVYLDFTA